MIAGYEMPKNAPDPIVGATIDSKTMEARFLQ